MCRFPTPGRGWGCGRTSRRLGRSGVRGAVAVSGTGLHRYRGQNRPTRIRSGRTCLPTQPPLTFAGANRPLPPQPPVTLRPRDPATATLLRPGLLEGVRVLLAAAEPPSRLGEAVIARCAELRATPAASWSTRRATRRRRGRTPTWSCGTARRWPGRATCSTGRGSRCARSRAPPGSSRGAGRQAAADRPAALRLRRRGGPLRPREPRAHAVGRVGALRHPHRRAAARRGHGSRRGGRARRLPRLAAGDYYSGCAFRMGEA